MPDGILILDKPAGPTSHDMVNLLRRGTGERRAGHAGTLDPLATGVLVLCLGAATRFSEYLIGEDKRYLATVRLGAATTTYDAQGEVTAASPVDVSRDEFEQALAAFRGEIQQTPPAYSAVKQKGRKAYERARRGETVTLAPRAVRIYELELTGWAPPDAEIAVHCSAGTYVRSLAHDLGQTLGCGAHLKALRRTAAGRFTVDEAVTVEQLSAGFADGSWAGHLLPVEAAVPDWPRLRLGPAEAARLARGSPVPGEPAAGPALAFGPDGRLLAVVVRDQAAGLWRPRKVFESGNS